MYFIECPGLGRLTHAYTRHPRFHGSCAGCGDAIPGVIDSTGAAYHRRSDNYVCACPYHLQEVRDNYADMWADYCRNCCG